ncbi:YeiH family protein [Oceanobacillus kimchii]|uniref:YeiH family protein n=1 Tax=Oceanobacillus kimchii TaxID=746691 RepID=UPI003B01D7D8
MEEEKLQSTNTSEDKKGAVQKLVGGIAFTFFIAFIGYLIAFLPGFSYIGQLACAIFIAILYRQLFGYPERLRVGITFSSKKILRIAIVLYGLRLNINTVINDGAGLLLRDACIVIAAILLMIYLGKLVKANKNISLLLGVGTGVCGAAAIAAVAPIIKAKDEDAAIGVAIIALMGTVFSIMYTILRPILPFTEVEYGIWSGISLHELAHVALAAAPAGEEGLAIALLAKLGRVFLLIPLCFLFIYMMNRKKKASTKEQSTIPFPWFLVGFIVLSLIGTYVLDDLTSVSDSFMEFIYTLTTWLLTAAMVGLGLSVSLKDLKTKAMRPLIAMVTTSVIVSLLAYLLV